MPGLTCRPCVCRFVVCDACGMLIWPGQTTRVPHWRRHRIEQLVDVLEDERCRRWRLAVDADFLLHAADGGREHVRPLFERVWTRADRDAPQVRAEMVAHGDAKPFVAANADRRTGARAVEAVERGEPVAGRHGTRRIRVPDHVEDERLTRPIRWPPHPGLRPVFSRNRGQIDDGVGRRRSWRLLTLSGAWRLAALATCLDRRGAEHRETGGANSGGAEREHLAPADSSGFAIVAWLGHAASSRGAAQSITQG